MTAATGMPGVTGMTAVTGVTGPALTATPEHGSLLP